MGLRDLLLLVTVYGSIPFILRKPFVGILVWYWLSLMNPHRLSWSLENQALAQIIAIVMLGSLLIARQEKKYIPSTPITITLAAFWVWMLLTTVFAFYPDDAWKQWDKVWKIMLTTYVAIIVLNSKERIITLTAICALSIGFFGIKGGYFTVTTGGNYRVWGPPGSFIGGNNELGLALIMTIPLLFYFRTLVRSRLLKQALLVGIILTFFSVLGTQSRGAFLGVTAMGLYLAFKSQRKVAYLMLIIVVVPTAFFFMPVEWHERMATIANYETDASAMGRIKAWQMALNLALHEPFGWGFGAFGPQAYLMYLPEVGARGTDAHSIYFEILGEQGFIGLALFLLLGIFAMSACARIIKQTKGQLDMQWMQTLAAMIQVSLIGYAVSGAFLGLAYFDLYYALLAIIVGMTVVLKQRKDAADAIPRSSAESDLLADGSLFLPPGPESKWRVWVARAREWYRRL